jgi:hypothetical protein
MSVKADGHGGREVGVSDREGANPGGNSDDGKANRNE